MSLNTLPADLVARVSESLGDRSLASLALSSKALRDSILGASGDAVFLRRAREQAGWRLSAGGGGSGETAAARYRHAHLGARQLRGAPLIEEEDEEEEEAATASAAYFERLRSHDPPQRALLLLSPEDADAPPERWSLPEVCATQDHRLWWWRPPAVKARRRRRQGRQRSQSPEAEQQAAPAAPPPAPAPCFAARSAAAARERRRWLRDPSRRQSPSNGAHTAAIEAVVALQHPGGPSSGAAAAAGGGRRSAASLLPLGYASASLDRTVKLWRPFPQRSRRASNEDDDDEDDDDDDEGGGAGVSLSIDSGNVEPLRTLRGHQEGVTALAAVPRAADSGGCCSCVLASASLDRTVRVWSLPPSLGGAGGGSGGGGGPLLATLRGHGGAITSLSLLPQPLLASAGMDCRVKVWDLQACGLSSTHRLSAPAAHLLALGSSSSSSFSSSSFSSPLLLAAVSLASFEVVDPRAPTSGSSSSSTIPSVLLPRTLAPIRCCAAHGHRVALGHRAGAELYDLRMLRPASAGAGGATAIPLLSARHPPKAPCDALALDRDKLVTATAAVRLHAGHAVWCWDVDGGGGGGAEGRAAAASSAAARLVSRHSAAAHPVQLADDSLPAPTPAAGTFDALFTGGGEEAAWELLQAMEAEPADAAAAGAGARAAPPAGVDEEAAAGFWDGADEGAAASAASPDRFFGRLEPGVLALALGCGGAVLGTVDTLGSAVVRDFRRLPRVAEAEAPLAGSDGGGSGDLQAAGAARGSSSFFGEGFDGGARFWEAPPT
jgi:hypothetical protein